MSMENGALTPEAIESNFKRLLQGAIDTGSLTESNTGLNDEVEKAIIEVAHEYPSVTAVSIQNAQQAWRRQLSGARKRELTASVAAVAATLGYDTGDSLA